MKRPGGRQAVLRIFILGLCEEAFGAHPRDMAWKYSFWDFLFIVGTPKRLSAEAHCRECVFDKYFPDLF